MKEKARYGIVKSGNIETFSICPICEKKFKPIWRKQILCGNFDCKIEMNRIRARDRLKSLKVIINRNGKFKRFASANLESLEELKVHK